MFGLRRRAEPASEIEAMRLTLVHLLRDMARRSPDPDGYLESRRAEITTALGGAGPWDRHYAALREIGSLFEAARAGLSER